MSRDHHEQDEISNMLGCLLTVVLVIGYVTMVMLVKPLASTFLGSWVLGALAFAGIVTLIAFVIDCMGNASVVPRPGDKKSRMMSRVYLTYLLEQVGPETWLDNYSESKLKAECPFTNEERRKYILVQEARIFRDELIQNRLLSGTTKQ